jgi:hypothetical protein|tara:strand:+ start:271 stop:645 length:375 start_codon:yes stop_codon:yes gene_type:complete
MAFTATVSHIGGRDILVTISETNVGASSEATITGLPKKGILLSQLADKTAGSASTIDPRVTTASGSTLATQTVIENDTAAASISNLASPPIPYYSADGKLYVKSGADSGSDNSITTVLLIRAGW